jgi:K+-sensing histidine kinase KdpD
MPASEKSPKEVYRFERAPWNQRRLLLLLCSLLVVLDYRTLPYQIFPFLFIFPVMLAAWNRGFWPAAGCALVLAGTRFTHHTLMGDPPFSAAAVFNALIRVGILVLLAWLVAIIANQTRQLRHRVQQLEGLLPICAGCKAIRDSRGQWVRVEQYISGHSEATFTHGLCPGCVKKLYGDLPMHTPHEGL